MQRLGPARNKVANGNITFSDPWALVEQPRSFQKWRKIDLDERAAEALDGAQHLRETPHALFIAEKLKLVDARHTEAATHDLSPCRSRNCPLVARERICGVETRRLVQDCRARRLL